jgi:hypothetical protein
MKSKLNGKLLGVLCGSAVAMALLVAAPVAMSRDQTDPSKQMKDAAKDAAKQAKDAVKKAGDAAKDAVKDATGMPEMTPEMMEAQKRFEANSAISDHHKHLAKYEGEWEIVSKFWMDPSAPPQEQKMQATAKLAMGGRYLIEKVWGDVDMGNGPEKFEGMSTTGYDNQKKMYFSTWIDNNMSGLWEEWGTCSEGEKVLTMEGKNYDPWMGTERPTKSISTIIDANNRKLEMFQPGPDGKMFKNMELVYTRKK